MKGKIFSSYKIKNNKYNRNKFIEDMKLKLVDKLKQVKAN